MSLNMSLEAFKHLIRFFLIIGIASPVSAIFPVCHPRSEIPQRIETSERD